MLVFKRNHVIITALAIMVAVAGYLNYADSKKSLTESGITLNDQGQIDALVPDYYLLQEDDNPSILTQDAIPASGIVSDSDSKNDNLGEAVFVSSNTTNSFFVQAKLDREQTRSKEKDILREMINNMNIEQEKRAEYADAMLEIQQRIEKETAAEAMIEAKGFSEVYVRIDDETVDVVVNKQALTDAEIAQIEDIVKRKTGMAADKIRISTIKK